MSGRFAGVWQRLGGPGGRLGQPLDPPVEDTFVEQHFERGWMHWGWLDREGEPERTVHVVAYRQEEGNHWSGDLWGRFTDYWQEGDGEHACPEAGPPYGPRRGFGLVWCQYVRGSLGAPLEEEHAVQAATRIFKVGRCSGARRMAACTCCSTRAIGSSS